MDTVSIRNVGKKHWTLILEHEQVCVHEGRCFCIRGKAGSIHLPAGSTVRDVPRSALKTVDAMSAGKDLRVCATAATEPVKISAPTESTDEEKKTTGKGRKRQGSID